MFCLNSEVGEDFAKVIEHAMNISQFLHQPFLNLHCQVFIKEGDEDEDMILIEEGIAIVTRISCHVEGPEHVAKWT